MLSEALLRLTRGPRRTLGRAAGGEGFACGFLAYFDDGALVAAAVFASARFIGRFATVFIAVCADFTLARGWFGTEALVEAAGAGVVARGAVVAKAGGLGRALVVPCAGKVIATAEIAATVLAAFLTVTTATASARQQLGTGSPLVVCTMPLTPRPRLRWK